MNQSDVNQNTAGSAAAAQVPGDSAGQRSWVAHSSPAEIQQLQRELASRGLYQGVIDGVAGPQTTRALQAFQQQVGLPTAAGLDEQTRQALGLQFDKQPVSGAQTSSSPSSAELDRSPGRDPAATVTGSEPFRSQVPLQSFNQDQLRTLQTHLQELGFYQGPVDGVLGDQTRSSLRHFFQTQADLASRGIVSDSTVGVFGLHPRDLEPAVGTAMGTPHPGTIAGAASGSAPRSSQGTQGASPQAGSQQAGQGQGGQAGRAQQAGQQSPSAPQQSAPR